LTNRKGRVVIELEVAEMCVSIETPQVGLADLHQDPDRFA
jgi:hypothetical protein